jgi:starch synthase
MKVALSTLGRFHSFDLARQLHARSMLEGIWSGYPRFKLKGENLPESSVHTFPYVHAPYMANRWRHLMSTRMIWDWELLDRVSLDRHVARRLPECDVFVGLSSSALATGRVAQRRGAKHVCDRGSTHIAHQAQVMAEEHAAWGVPFEGVDPRIIAREEAEYDQADVITVPSSAARQSFIDRGFAADKVALLPYGVDLDRFHPAGDPATDSFDMLFVGGVNLRKGIPYLLQAYQALAHPRKSLTIAGIAEEPVLQEMRRRGLLTPEVRIVGHVPQPELKTLMSRSHLLVLPSVEEGLALVMAQSMACGLPVLATVPTGAANLFDDGQEGFIVPERDSKALADRMQRLCDEPALATRMRAASLARVSSIGGWSTYGENAASLYRRLAGRSVGGAAAATAAAAATTTSSMQAPSPAAARSTGLRSMHP